MADNVRLSEAVGTGALMATDEVAGGVADGAQVPRNKVGYGADGAYTEVEGATTGLPVRVSDGSGIISPATSGKQDTGNTSLASIDGKITAVNTGAVVVSSSALPSGASTSANQTTIIGHLDGVETELAVISTNQLPDGHNVTVDNAAGVSAVNIQDGGNTITVDGTVTVGSISSGDNNIGNVDVVSSALPSGASTLTEQQSQTTHLSNIATSVGTLDNAIAGSEMQVDVVAALPAGTNNIGDVDVLTLPALSAGTNNIGDVDVLTIAAGDNNIGNVDLASAIPAGTALIGKVAAGLDTSNLYDGSTALVPLFATIDTATSGDNTIVAADTDEKYRILAISLYAVGTAVNVYLKLGSTEKLGSATRPIILDVTGATGPAGFVQGFCPVGWFEGADNEAIVLNLSAAQGVVGNIVYAKV